MKLQISFDLVDLEKAISMAHQVAPYTDIMEIGSILLYAHGVQAVKKFRETFKQTTLVVDAKLVDRPKDAVTLLAKAGADWITVMSGTRKEIIHSACMVAHALDRQIMIDLLDASSAGQSALEAKSFGGDALIFSPLLTECDFHVFLDNWNMVKQNTTLPVYLSGKITPEIIENLSVINPDGLIISCASLGENIGQEIENLQAAIKAALSGNKSQSQQSD